MLITAGCGSALAASPASPVPPTAAQASDFARPGWEVLAVANGDLDGDGRADAAVVLTRAAAGGKYAQGARLLVLALRGRDGRLRRSAVSSKAVMCEGCGGAMGDPFAGLRIERDTVVLQHAGGSGVRWATTHRLRYRSLTWELVEVVRETSNPGTGELRETARDLVTGRVVVRSRAAHGQPMTESVVFELYAAPVDEPPEIDGILREGEWPGRVLFLDGPASVLSGREHWSGSKDASARLGAVTHGGWLYLWAEVTDDDMRPGDRLMLVDWSWRLVGCEAGKVVPAKAYRTLEMRCELARLRFHPSAALALVTLAVVDVDSGAASTTVLATSASGQGRSGVIRFVTHHDLPTLEELDVTAQ